ncbi:hypothetical protein SEA_PUREGLOBE5_101 [Arthrobacter phage Pureglobe5]|nr:hypothetical protein SEA_PUREGLOBE5_101 [Arthrobacter phage Pureglobe5]
MSRRYIVTALGPDGKVQVQATHDTPNGAIAALGALLSDGFTSLTKPDAARRLMNLWLAGGDTFEVLSGDFQTTCSITIIDE